MLMALSCLSYGLHKLMNFLITAHKLSILCRPWEKSELRHWSLVTCSMALARLSFSLSSHFAFTVFSFREV